MFYWHKIPKVLISDFPMMIRTKPEERGLGNLLFFLSSIDSVLGMAKHKDGLSAQKHFVLRYLATEGLTATTVCLNDMGKMFLVDKWGWGAALLFGKTLYVIQAYVSSRILQDRNNANPKQLDTFLGFSFLASTATN